MAGRKNNGLLKPIPVSSIRMFKIANRRGYAAVAQHHLTEGSTPLQAYERLRKACRRSGLALPEMDAKRVSRLASRGVR